MPLVVPEIESRKYDQILAEALARIPVHNPEWTNFNDSDPGITLVQLFAFMTENLLYRSNLIPKRNRIKFLQLLGIPLQPAAAAQGIVTFSNLRGPLQTVMLSDGLEVLAGKEAFRTMDGLYVLPVEARVYYKSAIPEEQRAEVDALYRKLYASFLEDEDVALDFYETKPLEPPTSGAAFPAVNLAEDTLDGSLWVALLARSSDPFIMQQTREAIGNKVLTLGILPALSEGSHVLLPGGPPSAEGKLNLIFQIPRGGRLPDEPEQRAARYDPLDARPSGDLLSDPGVVELPLPDGKLLQLWDNLEPLEPGTGDFPPSLEDTDIQTRVITWVRIRLREESSAGTAGQLSARLSWVGINAARVTQRVRVFAEDLGRGTGEPDQVVTLVNTPVIPSSVELTVNGEAWQEIDDLMAADSEVPVRSPRLTPVTPSPSARPEKAKVFTVNRESGEIRFGDGLHGGRPQLDATMRANYYYGGGRQGNVGIGAISKGPALPAGLKVTNPIPTWGGDEAESVEEAERGIPRYLQHRDRLVSQTDFKEITRRTPGVDLGRVEVLPLFHPNLDVPAGGVVTVLVIPLYDSIQPDAPVPDRLFLETVCKHLNPRRLITTEVYVRGPTYVQVWLSVGIEVVPGYNVAPVREAVKAALREFVSPLKGGFEETGWPLEKAVEALELWAVATRVEGVSKVNKVLLGTATGAGKDRIPMSGLELPWLVGLSVQPGDPQELEKLRGDSGAFLPGGEPGVPPVPPKKVVPVPVVPSECR